MLHLSGHLKNWGELSQILTPYNKLPDIITQKVFIDLMTSEGNLAVLKG